MKFVSIGTPAVSRSCPRTRSDARAGFTLLEALVALTILLAFAATVGPLLSQARRIVANADGRVAAQILLRALLADPIDPANVAGLAREGASEGLSWRVVAEPSDIEVPEPRSAPRAATAAPAEPPTHWVAFRVVASVSWAPGQLVTAETIRLGKSE
jgi:prepilin-type N-terminal cleavage/methylation domain-containing protein